MSYSYEFGKAQNLMRLFWEFKRSRVTLFLNGETSNLHETKGNPTVVGGLFSSFCKRLKFEREIST
jgi:hypothetical protein